MSFNILFYRKPFDHIRQHVPCIAHVVNLAVQAMLGKNGVRSPPSSNHSLYDDDDADGAIPTGVSTTTSNEDSTTASAGTTATAFTADSDAAEAIDEEESFLLVYLGDEDIGSVPGEMREEEEHEDEEEEENESQVQVSSSNPLDKLRKGIRKVR